MESVSDVKRFLIDENGLPESFPTHRNSAQFWEQLGRTVATFGFLEEILGKAIFVFTATRSYSSEEIDAAYEAWIPQLQRALTDQLWNLAESYGKAVRSNPNSTTENIDELVNYIKSATTIRNVLCHGSWSVPDKDGKSLPLFVNKSGEKFETLIDAAFLQQIQRHTTELACAVINSVAQMGWQFPGTTWPGKQVLSKSPG